MQPTKRKRKASPASTALLNAASMSLAHSIQDGLDRVVIQFDSAAEALRFRKDWYRFRYALRSHEGGGMFPRVYATKARMLPDHGVALEYSQTKRQFELACSRARQT